MEFTDQPEKSLGLHVLTFRAPAPALRMGGIPDLEAVPHDIGMLKRPMPVESYGAPRLQEMDGLAHDARNLMTSLTLISGLLGEPGVIAEKHRQYAGDLQSLTGSLSTLIERMASVSSPDAGGDLGSEREPLFVREPLRPRLASRPKASESAVAAQTHVHGSSLNQPDGQLQFDAGTMVKGCERLLAAIAGPGVGLHISFERGLGVLALGVEDLTRVLMNLVKNASEAMPKGGRVVVTVRKALGSNRAVLLTVQDSGAGIPAHAMGQIFQAGFTSKKRVGRWPSTAHHGLGLTIVRDLVEAAGGSVRVTSELRKGTTFELKVPCLKA